MNSRLRSERMSGSVESGTTLLTIVAIAGAAALASITGGAIALWRRSTTLFMSLALGFASGVLLATITFEMLPLAIELGSIAIAAGGFTSGLLAVYAFDLYIHRGQLAGEKAEQRPRVQNFYRLRRPRGNKITVLAGGTSAEELIEGLSIGIGAAIKPGVGLLIGLAIAIDNLSEGMSIGELIRDQHGRRDRHTIVQTLGWTGLIAAAVLASALVGWFLLKDLAAPVLALMFAAGAGGMFYLTVTDLLPESQERHYQQSSGLSIAAGFLTIFVLAQLS